MLFCGCYCYSQWKWTRIMKMFLSTRWILVLLQFLDNYFRFQNIPKVLIFLSLFLPSVSKIPETQQFPRLYCPFASWHSMQSCLSDTVSRCRECKSAVLHVNMRNCFLCATSIMEFVFSETQITFTCCSKQLSSRIFHKCRFPLRSRHIHWNVTLLAMKVCIQLYGTFNANLVRI